MLEHIRVVDLCDGISQFAGHLLASCGAEVIAVEPPQGVSTRHDGPFVGDRRDPESSLTHWAYNRGKKSVAIDLTSAEGQERFLELLTTSDVLFEDSRPGALVELGLDHEQLSAANPGLVHASITPYGSTGPRSHWKGSDLTAVAGSGFLHASGDHDRPPVRVALPMSMLHAAGDAADAALIALRERARSGLGQHIDCSAQESVTIGFPNNLSHLSNAARVDRFGGGITIAGMQIPLMYPCKDGHCMCVALMGAVFARFSQRLVAWEAEEGFADDELTALDYGTLGAELLAGERSPDILAKANAAHRAFLASKTKDELWQGAFDRSVLLTPSATVADLVANDHLAARDFWVDLPVGKDRTARFPGPLVRFATDQPEALGPAPRLGEHADAIDMSRRPTLPAEPRRDGSLPLAGLNVVEFSWVIATPSAVRVLNDYGATVIKVETASRPDTMRTVNPFHDEVAHPDNSVGYGVYNAGKKSLALDLSAPTARDVVFDLIRWADITTESFAPGSFGRMGFGYDVLSEVNPQLIMLSSSLLGQTGPASSLAGYGFMAAALAGIYDITGWLDRGPAGPYGPYTDYLAPRVVLMSLLSALEHRDRTGRGQYIDLSQTEAALHYLAPAILDQSVNGRTLTRCGNDDPHRFPHGVFPTAGNDQWVAIAFDDDSWRDFASSVLDRRDFAGMKIDARRAHRDEIEAAITAWSSGAANDDVAATLQGMGVEAYPVHDTIGVTGDPQLAHRGHLVKVPQSHAGEMWTHACRTKMSRTPARLERGGACEGEDTFEILSEILGYDADRIAELAAAEVLQ